MLSTKSVSQLLASVLLVSTLSLQALAVHAQQGITPIQSEDTIIENATELDTTPACITGAEVDGICVEDTDNDGVADTIDLCIDESQVNVNAFGCTTGMSITLDAVDFATGRTYLNAKARTILDKVAKVFVDNNEQIGVIGAHTDNVGDTSNNLQLSKKRANAVRQYLMLKGVNPNAIKATGYGEQYPIAKNSTEDGRRLNRRVELALVNK